MSSQQWVSGAIVGGLIADALLEDSLFCRWGHGPHSSHFTDEDVGSGMYERAKKSSQARGNFKSYFRIGKRLATYLNAF